MSGEVAIDDGCPECGGTGFWKGGIFSFSSPSPCSRGCVPGKVETAKDAGAERYPAVHYGPGLLGHAVPKPRRKLSTLEKIQVREAERAAAGLGCIGAGFVPSVMRAEYLDRYMRARGLESLRALEAGSDAPAPGRRKPTIADAAETLGIRVQTVKADHFEREYRRRAAAAAASLYAPRTEPINPELLTPSFWARAYRRAAQQLGIAHRFCPVDLIGEPGPAALAIAEIIVDEGLPTRYGFRGFVQIRGMTAIFSRVSDHLEDCTHNAARHCQGLSARLTAGQTDPAT